MGGKAKWSIGPGGHLVLSTRKMEHFFGPGNAARIQLCCGCFFFATIHHPHPNPTKNTLIFGLMHLALSFLTIPFRVRGGFPQKVGMWIVAAAINMTNEHTSSCAENMCSAFSRFTGRVLFVFLSEPAKFAFSPHAPSCNRSLLLLWYVNLQG